MRRAPELEQRLVEWADEFSGGRYENLAYPSKSWLYQAMTYHGRSPQGLNPRNLKEKTPADQVEEAVRELEKQRDGYRAGRVLRAEYWMKGAPEEAKLQALRQIGQSMSRATFYDQLWVARVHVAAWLHISASVSLPAA